MTVSFPKADSDSFTVVLTERSMEADETLTVVLMPARICPFVSTLPDVNMERGALQELITKHVITGMGEKTIDFICIIYS